MSVKLDAQHLSGFMNPGGPEAIGPQTKLAHELLHSKSGPGSNLLGWLDSPSEYDKGEFSRIQSVAAKICLNTDVFVVIGIGGSYPGARAAIEFLKSSYYNSMKKDTSDIYFVGNSISSSALVELLSICEGKDVSISMVSKSSTTTELATASHMFRELLEKKYGKKGVRRRIYCTTDRACGTLKKLTDQEGYEAFVAPDDIGGRYSVLTAVGLLPIAVSGADLNEPMQSALQVRDEYLNPDLQQNSCYQYVTICNLFYRKGKTVELLASYESCFAAMCEWWKQLYGESEGKDQKGLLPAFVIFSTDLHSMGQYVQDGRQIPLETVVLFEHTRQEITLGNDPENMNGLNFLQGNTTSYINEKAFEGIVLAHADGGVPNTMLRVSDFLEKSFGGLICFFEKARAVSDYLLGVNPFDQPGVESYEKNMLALLGKSGYEAEKAALEVRLKHREILCFQS